MIKIEVNRCDITTHVDYNIVSLFDFGTIKSSLDDFT